jgi:two-component system CheB/CheR fusion protein
VTLKDVEWRPAGGEPRMLEIQVVPLAEDHGAPLGVVVSFLDLTLQHQLATQLKRTHQDLETAYEDLQSANEELETTNEELQSTVEELETTNEELQSTNEELRSMNDQLQQRSDELRTLNTYLRSILGSLSAAVVVLNADLTVEIWSDKAQELWGLRDAEAKGQPFQALDIGLPVETLVQPIRASLDSGPRGIETVVAGVNRRGRPVRCRVTCTRLGEGPGSAGVILLMEEEATSGAAAGA